MHRARQYLWQLQRSKWYNYFYLVTIVFGAILSMKDVINIIDIAYALMAVPTTLVGLILAPKVMVEAKSYFTRMKGEL